MPRQFLAFARHAACRRIWFTRTEVNTLRLVSGVDSGPWLLQQPGSLMLAAMRHVSSRVSRLAGDRRPGSSSKYT